MLNKHTSFFFLNISISIHLNHNFIFHTADRIFFRNVDISKIQNNETPIQIQANLRKTKITHTLS